VIGTPLNELKLEQLRSIEKSFGPDALKVFDLNQAMGRRKGIGSPGTTEVKRQLAKWGKVLDFSP